MLVSFSVIQTLWLIYLERMTFKYTVSQSNILGPGSLGDVTVKLETV